MSERTYYIGKIEKDIVELVGISKNRDSQKMYCNFISDKGAHLNLALDVFVEEYWEVENAPIFTATMNKPIQSDHITMVDNELFDAKELAYLEIHKNIKPLMVALRRRLRRNAIMIDTEIEPNVMYFFNYTKTTEDGDYWSQQLIKELKIIVRNIYGST
jgi:hypothetical protein